MYHQHGLFKEASHYSFRANLTDLSLWVMLTDLQPHQQCAAIITRLGGAARLVAKSMTAQEIATGGQRNGVQLDPMTYMISTLLARFTKLGEEPDQCHE